MNDEKIKSIENYDTKIHTKILNKIDTINSDIVQKNMRWASGGCVAIVQYNDQYYIPMFYRDIPACGWNIMLGGSERGFRQDGRLYADVEQQLNEPKNIAYREFCEEFLVLKSIPNCKSDIEYINYDFGDRLGRKAKFLASEFNTKHLELRRDYDNLDLKKGTRIIKPNTFDTKIKLKIISDDFLEDDIPIENIIVCTNLTELGIEVVKIIEMKLENDWYLLDGEILNEVGTDELVRMPIGLIPFDFIYDNFSSIDNFEFFRDSENEMSTYKLKNGSIKLKLGYFFDYDLRRRKEIIELKQVSDTDKKRITNEKKRYNKAKDYFNYDEFEVLPEKMLIFTPATVKTLSLMLKYVPGIDKFKSTKPTSTNSQQQN